MNRVLLGSTTDYFVIINIPLSNAYAVFPFELISTPIHTVFQHSHFEYNPEVLTLKVTFYTLSAQS